ncbi:thioredoxin family protein [Neopusillimonas maritima]|jgi:thiol-disulfide isomerase/thioredoxin|uniref:Thioredoxin domain-containing protein n=1 Tax=Neopusillimonas maritima TaxID=2026239 RepID=A0ABX9MZ77_9BURK|nr:thioredoxin family protein [Neopusillimonas maritima]MAL01503.1 thiol reductase thioredoxin [Alcaligenaceae bacterium]MBF23482.1 thiol reductase thioredoxin [Pusillimonas sp.]RII84267.1 hypothetical protein CJO09_03365 [Neopusillimonas maritima]|tara:strand:- start:2262 stop:2648 length:387 start_codon:yes stop_codon:yes gene_type:complete
MSFYLLPNDLTSLQTAFASESIDKGVSVICYCAEWCDTCRQYLNDFRALAAQWPTHTFIWVDIEENPELLDEEDVENFPTVLIQDDSGNRFFGPLLPHIGHLETLLRKAPELPASQSGPGPVASLVNN